MCVLCRLARTAKCAMRCGSVPGYVCAYPGLGSPLESTHSFGHLLRQMRVCVCVFHVNVCFHMCCLFTCARLCACLGAHMLQAAKDIGPWKRKADA